MKNLSLQHLESRSWKRTQQDGLLDVFLGIVLFTNALSMLFDELGTADAIRIGATLSIYVAGIVGVWLVRRRLVLPRTGVAKFNASRQNRVRWTRVALGISVLVTLALFALVSIARFAPAQQLRFLGDYGPSSLIGIVIMVPMAVLAIALEYPRLVIHGLLFVAAEFATVACARSASLPFPGTVIFSAASAISLTTGIVVLARLLRTKPRARTDVPKGWLFKISVFVRWKPAAGRSASRTGYSISASACS